jgi:hypothetical protein
MTLPRSCLARPERTPRVPDGRPWWRSAYLALAAVVALMVWHTLVRNWDRFRSLSIAVSFEPAWIALSALATFAAYGLQIEAWRRILAGSDRPSYARAARIQLLANLARYVPGKVWGVAALVVLTERAGLDPWTAGTSAFTLQAVAVGTGVAVAATTIPVVESWARLTAAGAIAAATFALLVSAPVMRWVVGRAGRSARSGPLSMAAAGESVALMLAAWLAHGGAFSLLSHGISLTGPLRFTTAAGVFACASVAGVLALFAPAGVGVRELALIALLTPTLGTGGAVALSVGSRLLLTMCELLAALGAVLVGRAIQADVLRTAGGGGRAKGRPEPEGRVPDRSSRVPDRSSREGLERAAARERRVI